MSGKTWGRVVGITLAVLSAASNFAFLPYHRFWSPTTITLELFVISALSSRPRHHPLNET